MIDPSQAAKLILAPLVAIIVPLLAQITNSAEQFPWVQFVSPVASSAMLAWYLWYDVSKARPKRDREHKDERLEWRSDLMAERTRYESILKDQETRHAARMSEEDERREKERQEFLAALKSVNCKHP